MQDEINDYLNIVALNIAKLRHRANITQEELAEKTNCTREFINRVENYKERVSLKMLLTISCVLEISPAEFFKP